MEPGGLARGAQNVWQKWHAVNHIRDFAHRNVRCQSRDQTTTKQLHKDRMRSVRYVLKRIR
jgi:hypothetical protein